MSRPRRGPRGLRARVDAALDRLGDDGSVVALDDGGEVDLGRSHADVDVWLRWLAGDELTASEVQTFARAAPDRGKGTAFESLRQWCRALADAEQKQSSRTDDGGTQ